MNIGHQFVFRGRNFTVTSEREVDREVFVPHFICTRDDGREVTFPVTQIPA